MKLTDELGVQDEGPGNPGPLPGRTPPNPPSTAAPSPAVEHPGADGQYTLGGHQQPGPAEGRRAEGTRG